ncbi:imidazolonepropionase [Belnapia sp. T6]|uniref:Imidazolonepropionase n=1 Tax=Belnapia mucosa TaxID=2804532 RepID=A0ABS1V046_9PROT|nr:imidazolonepropionase [Belnapia mucosa]MBL6455083.1 imidazolonepropionase [Belnapia mucosa]
MFDRIWLNAHLATMESGLGIIEDGAVAARDGRIAWVGPRAALPGPAAETVDCEGAWILPGLIDCHTHLVFGGDRAEEFERRLAGEDYAAILRAGGGILSTVRATRAADEASLLDAALPRAQALMAEGVTTIEIKSGYGLEQAAELRQLRAARRVAEMLPVAVRTTLLAAHAVPPDYAGRRADYARLVAEAMVPAAQGLADAVDIFHDPLAFDSEDTRLVLGAAREAGLPVKLHGDQHGDVGSAALGAELGALSVDHLEHANPAGLTAMSRAGTVAVLLPGATLFLRETRMPDIAAMRTAGVRMAVATDCNPGSSPTLSLLLMLNLACTLYRLTVEEALRGVTVEAAAALGLQDRGRLAPGLRCDLALYRIGRPAELCYWMGRNPCIGRVLEGR